MTASNYRKIVITARELADAEGVVSVSKGHMAQTYDHSKPEGWPEDQALRFPKGRIFTRKNRVKLGADEQHCSCCRRAGLREWVELRAAARSIYHYKYCVICIDQLAKSARCFAR